MLDKKSSLYSQDNLTLKKSEDSVDQVNKAESEIKEETVKFKMDVECSKDFAENFLREYFSVLKGRMESQGPNKKANVYPKRPMLLDQTQLPTPTNENRQSESENVRELSNWRRKISISIFLILLMSLSMFAGYTYLKSYKKRVSELAQHEIRKMNTNLYEAILVQNLDNLLNKLDELTAIPRMRNAFPEITSLSSAARFKRGPEPTEKAKASINFLWRVKYLFDSWTERPHNLSIKLKPTEKDIALFLSIWEDTKVLLDQLETSKQKPVEILTNGYNLTLK